MSSQALLDAIETTGKGQLARLEQETRERVDEILAETEKTAASRRDAAYRDALGSLTAERARRLHEAQMEALKITAAARDQAAQKLLALIEARLQALRDDPQYPAIFRHLVEEAFQRLGEQESAELPHLEVDARDVTLAQDILLSQSWEVIIVPTLTSWGGAVARSGDGRITVTNTLENRLEQLKSHLGQFLSKEYV
ncbi:MAG: V-type ATP synthase subunit E [Candidatus Promineifilaceae bacterium]